MSTIIGTIDVPTGSVDRSYETAAWYQTFDYPAQTADVVYTRGFPMEVSWTVQGRNTYDYFPSLFGGVATGGGRIGEIDEPATYTFRQYDYSFAEGVALGDRPDVTLVDGVQISAKTRAHPVSCQGFVTLYNQPDTETGYKYLPCDCKYHLNAHGERIDERNSRGFIAFGYVPDDYRTRTHFRVLDLRKENELTNA